MNEPAPAKINLCLFLGGTRSDGRHELVTLFESISLADRLGLTVLEEGQPDQVICPAVEAPNLVSAALAALRRQGWTAPPVRIEIDKRIPVAAGLGGGSADAAAALRLAQAVAAVPAGAVERIARELGADVPSQLEPGLWLGEGAGERLEQLAPLATHALVIVPAPFPLSTADVYREADRLGLPRVAEELAEFRDTLAGGCAPHATLPDALVVNDLQAAAISLAPGISRTLREVEQAGAHQALVCGSGPTVMGVFWGEDASERAASAARGLAARHPATVSAQPVSQPSRVVRHNGGRP